jgi:arylsulfatase A-like enzyme
MATRVVLVTLDTLRNDALGCYGNPRGLTPFMDSLCASSVRFTRAYSTGPYTQAAFPGLLCSSFYLDYGQPKGLAPERELLSEVLNRKEITTAGFHSNPYICSYFGWNRGWSMFYDSMEEDVDLMVPYVKGDAINRKVDEWLGSFIAQGPDRPLFLWVHYMDIHEPYVPSRKYLDMVDPSVTINQERMFELFKSVFLPRKGDPETAALFRTLYDAHVREVDDYVKGLFEILSNRGLAEDTTVILTADHGDEFGDHGGLSHDDTMYDELVRVPLLIYRSSISEGSVYEKLASTLDIAPTVTGLFGISPPEKFQGLNLFPLEEYSRIGCHGEALDQKAKKGGDLSRDTYFYVEGYDKAIYRAYSDAWELYDLAVDPAERKNLADDKVRLAPLRDCILPRVRRWERCE